MAPKHLHGAELGNDPTTDRKADGAVLPSPVRREGPRDDIAFMEEVVRELAAQNESARADSERLSRGPLTPAEVSAKRPAFDDEDTPASRGVEGAREPRSRVVSGERRSVSGEQLSAERPRTVRVEKDSGFRTPEGVASARAYLPVKTVAPGRPAEIETETVKVSDPRRLPTVRVNREGRDSREPGEPGDTGRSARGPRLMYLEDSAPTLRSAPGVKPEPQQRGQVSFWIGAVVVAAVAGVLVVALAARFWPGAPRALPSAQPSVSGHVASEAHGHASGGDATADPAHTVAPASASGASFAQPSPSGAPSVSASVDAPAHAPAPPRSDRWF